MSTPEESVELSGPETALAERLAQVYLGPEGPQIGAFFDFDGTLIDGFSAVDFYSDRIKRRQVGLTEAAATIALALRGITTEEDFERFVGIGFKSFRGHAEDEVLAAAQDVFAKRLASRIFPEAWLLLEAHRRMGHTLVVASSATRFQLEPAARELDIPHVLSTRVEVDDAGTLTGRTEGPTLWRAGKASAVRDFADAAGVDLTESYGYSNGAEDVGFLETVGHPAAIKPEPGLRIHAEAEGWPILDFTARGRPGLKQILRSAAGYGGLATGVVAGLGMTVLNGRKAGVDSMQTLAGELTLALAGVEVDVIGAEHLWSHRPAVFIFNHQSQLDVPLLCYLLQRDFTGVAKQELKGGLVIGSAMRLAGVAFVDRTGGKDPREALAPAVEKLHEGISVAIAPEGTRSLTPTVARFKKGAFHLARAAEVPVVPIVIRNAGELMWRDAATIRSGRLDVVVHPPIDVAAWPAEELTDRIEQVRQGYADTLARWPGEPIVTRAPERPKRARTKSSGKGGKGSAKRSGKATRKGSSQRDNKGSGKTSGKRR